MKKLVLIFSLLVFSVSMVWAEIYSEDFTGQNGKGATGGSPVSYDLSGVDWTLDINESGLTASTDWFKVESEEFSARDIDEEQIWFSPEIDISGITDIDISIDVSSSSGLETSDYIETGYQLDGGSFTTITKHEGNISGTITDNESLSSLSNSNLRIVVKALNGAGTEYYYFDNVSVEEPPVKPEPSNYPTSFTATANGYDQIDLTWSDNDGAQAADGFLIVGKTDAGSFYTPSDETDPTDDTNWSDDDFNVEVAHGVESYEVAGLNAETQYDFKIYPYTNSGSDIDFKTDGTVPTDDATTDAEPDIPALIISEVADPDDNWQARFIELYNNSGSEIDFDSETWYLSRQTNGGNWEDKQLTGSIAYMGTYVSANNNDDTSDNFYLAFGFLADFNFGGSSGNGDDGYFLYYDGDHTSGTLVDAYGVIDQDGSGQAWDYEDSRAVRGTHETVTQGNTTWTASEWEITSADVAGCTPGELDDDQTLPVTLSAFTAQFIDNTPTLYWTTQSETDNIGWFVYRNEEEDLTTSEKISQFIEGHGTTSQQQSYIYEDDIENPEVGDTYYYWIESVSYDGNEQQFGPKSITIPQDENENITPIIPEKYGLSQNYPNPVINTTRIAFNLHETANVDLAIYNLKGQLVKKLYSGITSKHTVMWDGKDEQGKELNNGIYLYRLLVNGKNEETKKLILMK